MLDKDNRCVYNGLEYILTGRRAVSSNGKQYVFEIKPVKTFGFGDELNLWAPVSDLFIIEESEEEQID